MNVLLVILHADSTRGGAEAYTVRLHHKLREAGHSVRMAATTFEPSIDVAHRVPLNHSGLTRSARYRQFLDAIDAHLAQTRYDIVHAMLPVNRCDVYHPHAGIESVTIKSAGLSQFGNRRRVLMAKVETDLLRAGTLVACPSQRMRDQIPTANAVVLHSVPDDVSFLAHRANPPAPSAKRPNEVRAAFVGQDFTRKGLDIALRAVAAVEHMTLDVVGRDEAAAFKALAAQLRVADRVRWLGSRPDVANVLAETDVFLLPSRHEPFGMVVIEAMLIGVPPVVSANAGAAEIINDGIDGRIVTGESPEQWSAAIRDVLARRQPMSAACVARRAELSYENHLKQLVGIYERVIADRQLAGR